VRAAQLQAALTHGLAHSRAQSYPARGRGDAFAARSGTIEHVNSPAARAETGPAVRPPGLAPADTAAVRRHNLTLALRHIAVHGPCARTEVAAATGLVHASVTGLVGALIERGLVREVGASATGARGRPRRLLRLVPERVMAIAVQVTLERVETMAADLAGTVAHRASVPHQAPFGEPGPLADVVAAEIARAVAAVCRVDGAHLAGAVVAMAGPVVGPGHTVAAAIDFGWRPGTDLRALVAARVRELAAASDGPAAPLLAGLPVDVVNDADVAALAEYHARAADAEPPQTMAYIKADTGVGGGLLIGGRVHVGARGMSGEVGHIPLALDGPPCACGARGCLALYIGPEPLTAAAGLADLAAAEGVDAALAELGRRLRADDPRAVAALADAGRVLGAAILSVTGLTDAGEVVLGGYLATWIRWLAPGLDAALAGRRAVAEHFEPAVVPGVLGVDATLRGALRTGLDAVFDDPASVPRRR
jgi:predicted NBD/HSP70 family sugar kinase